MKSESFLALLAGTAMGVVIGMLIAPEKGSDLRKKVKESVDEGSESLKNAKDRIVDKLKDLESALAQGVQENAAASEAPETEMQETEEQFLEEA
ncbi:MAG: YtxH domain-containing protein [Candidatus Cryptobacteroides sp.]